MAKREKKYKFYFFDYLWWLGERIHDNGNAKIEGVDMLMMYALVFVLVSGLLGYFSIGHSAVIVGIVFVLCLCFFFNRFYTKQRRKAVLEHYSARDFNLFLGYMAFFAPLIVMIGIGICFSGKSEKEIDQGANRRAMNKIVHRIRSSHYRMMVERYGEPVKEVDAVFYPFIDSLGNVKYELTMSPDGEFPEGGALTLRSVVWAIDSVAIVADDSVRYDYLEVIYEIQDDTLNYIRTTLAQKNEP